MGSRIAVLCFTIIMDTNDNNSSNTVDDILKYLKNIYDHAVLAL